MSTPDTAESTLRFHRQAVIDWLGGLLVDYNTAGGLFTTPKNGVPIIRVLATPNNALAAVADTLVNNNWVEGSTAEEKRQKVADFTVLPTPFLSVYFEDPALDPDIRGAAKYFINKPDNTLAYQFPAHYFMGFTVTSYASKRYTDDTIFEWMMSQFGTKGCMDNERLIPVTHNLPTPGSVWQQALRFQGASDTSELEGNAPVEYRHDYSLTLRTWLIKPAIVL